MLSASTQDREGIKQGSLAMLPLRNISIFEIYHLKNTKFHEKPTKLVNLQIHVTMSVMSEDIKQRQSPPCPVDRCPPIQDTAENSQQGEWFFNGSPHNIPWFQFKCMSPCRFWSPNDLTQNIKNARID